MELHCFVFALLYLDELGAGVGFSLMAEWGQKQSYAGYNSIITTVKGSQSADITLSQELSTLLSVKYFIYVNRMREVLLLVPFCRCGN